MTGGQSGGRAGGGADPLSIVLVSPTAFLPD